MRDWRASLLAVSNRDGIIQLHVPRPSARADECDRLAWAIVDATAALAEDQQVCRGVLITSGGSSFLVEPAVLPRAMTVTGAWQRAVDAVARIECPVVAAIRGDALGPSWQLALACDIRIATAGFRVGLPEIAADGPMFQPVGTFAREVGMSRALAAATVEPVMSTERALALGLLSDVVSPDRLDSAADELANTIRRSAPIAAAYAKEAVRRSRDLTLADGMQVEQDLNVLLQTTRDRAEGIAAFLERRTPQFRGQ